MFHLGDNLYAGRLNDAGDVRLLKFKSPPAVPPVPAGVYLSSLLVLDQTITAGDWASVFTAASRRGEIENRYYVALAFHNQVEPFAAWAGGTA